MKFWILLLVLSGGSLARAEWSLRPQAGVGYTDNAHYESSEKDPDLFWWVRSSNSYITENSYWNLWLNYRDYSKQTQNNVFSYRFGNTQTMKSPHYGEYEWDLAFGGQQYTRGAPGTTETSFNNAYIETSLLKSWDARRDLEMSLEPLYQLKYFPNFDERIDHTFALNFSTEWEFQANHSLDPFIEFGMVFSNQALYSKNYFEFGTNWQINSQTDLKYIFGFLSRSSTYPNRTVSETTAVSDRRGRIQMVSRDEIELHSMLQVQGNIVKIINKAELRGAMVLTSQTTRSGLEDFTEAQAQASVLVPF